MNNNESHQKFLKDNRSEEVTHIIEHLPTTFGRVVTGLVFFLIVVTGFFSWRIQYPEMLRGSVSLNAVYGDIKINANTTGKLELLDFKNGAPVNAGSFIGVIKNGANVNDIAFLDSLLKTFNIQNLTYTKHKKYFPQNLILGQISTKYFGFLNALYQYLDFTVAQPFEKKREIGNMLVTTQRKLKNDGLMQYNKLKAIMETAQSLNNRDSILFKNKIISRSDYEKSLLSRLSAEREFESINKDLNNSEYLINEATNKLNEIGIQKTEKDREILLVLLNAYHDLVESIVEWKHKYLLIAPISGKLDFIGFLKSEDLVQVGQELFSIVPIKNEIVGQLFLPELGAGKVRVGQNVIIKLDKYPYAEFGSINGKVKSISLISNQLKVQSMPGNSEASSNGQTVISGYLITISLPNELKTNYGTQLEFQFGAKGVAEIITENRRLIQRLFDNLKYRFNQS